MKFIDKLISIFYAPYRFILIIGLLFYFYRVFKNEMKNNNETLLIQDFFRLYMSEVIDYTKNILERTFVIKYIFSIIFWASILKLLIF